MASIVVDKGFPVGLGEIDLEDLGKVTSISKNSDRIVLNFGSKNSITLEGGPFQYKNGVPISGTVKELTLKLDGAEAVEAKGLKIKAAEVAQIAKSGDYNDFFDLLPSALGGNDYLAGGAGEDLIKGYNGNDRISGRGGNDELRGGKGDDTFLFQAALNEKTNVDRLTDFNHKDDSLHLASDVFHGLKDGDLSSDAFHIGTKAADKEDRIIYDKKHGDLYFDRDGTGSKYDTVKFAEVKDNTTVDHTDFLVI
jgi:Ca2+-binding RTX toxin-like protein